MLDLHSCAIDEASTHILNSTLSLKALIQVMFLFFKEIISISIHIIILIGPLLTPCLPLATALFLWLHWKTSQELIFILTLFICLRSYIISLNIRFFSWTNSSWVIVSVLKQPLPGPQWPVHFQIWSSRSVLILTSAAFETIHLSFHFQSTSPLSFQNYTFFCFLPFQLHLLGITVGSSSPS